MKKIIILITVLFFFKTSFSQYPNGIQTIGNDSNVVQAKGGFRGRVINWTYTDTSSANLERIRQYIGAQIVTTTPTLKFWIRNATATGWIDITSGGGASQTWQQTLITGSTLTQDNDIDVAGYDLRFSGADEFGLGADSVSISINQALGRFKVTGIPSTDTTLSLVGITANGYLVKTNKSSLRPYTFTNGLTESGGTVKLGGTLTEETSITGGGLYAFNIEDMNGIAINSRNNNSIELTAYETGDISSSTLAIGYDSIDIQPRASSGKVFVRNIPATDTTQYIVGYRSNGQLVKTTKGSLTPTLQEVLTAQDGSSILGSATYKIVGNTTSSRILVDSLRRIEMRSLTGADSSFSQLTLGRLVGSGEEASLSSEDNVTNFKSSIDLYGSVLVLRVTDKNTGVDLNAFEIGFDGQAITKSFGKDRRIYLLASDINSDTAINLKIDTTYARIEAMKPGGIESVFQIYPDSVLIKPSRGSLNIDTLTHSTTATDKMMVWDSVGQRVATRLIPSGGSGVTTLAAIGSSPNANGGTISGSTYNAEPASASFGGVVTTGTQTFAGAKTFNGNVNITGTNNQLSMFDGTAFNTSVNTITWGTNYNEPALLLYDGGSAGLRYGWGLRAGNMQFFIPDDGNFSVNSGGDFQASGTNEKFVVDRNNNRIRLNLATGIGTAGVTPVASALVEMSSTTQGFLPPRMTGTQAEAISSPAEGLMIYSTDGSGSTITTKGWWGYDGSTWVKLN